jgi:hypothetical protein
MSDVSDSQNQSEQHSDQSEGSSPAESFYEGERSSPDLPKAATRTRKKKTSDSEDEDFVASETTKKKKRVVLAKEYNSKPISVKEKTAVRKVPQETMQFALESDTEPAAGGKKKRVRKVTARVIGKPSMREDSEEEEEEPADAPPAKSQKLMADAMRTTAPRPSLRCQHLRDQPGTYQLQKRTRPQCLSPILMKSH